MCSSIVDDAASWVIMLASGFPSDALKISSTLMSGSSNGYVSPFTKKGRRNENKSKTPRREHRSIRLRFMPVEAGVQLSKPRLNLCREMADNEDVSLEIANSLMIGLTLIYYLSHPVAYSLSLTHTGTAPTHSYFRSSRNCALDQTIVYPRHHLADSLKFYSGFTLKRSRCVLP